ncbi:MAG: hydrolase [Pseudomonadota bacterium]|nr:hydrolase [Pseudomonadota bacterium]
MSTRFEPAWWLNNPHAQTMWGTLTRPQVNINLIRERIDTPDHDFLDLMWDASNKDDESRPIALILHGLAGCIRSPYAKGLMQAISAAGWRPVFMHFRGSSGEPNRLARYYHSGDTNDLAFVVSYLHMKYAGVPIAAIGISLGGNVILKWLGESANDNLLIGAVAVSVPFELHHAASYMDKGFSKVYQWKILRQLCADLFVKFQKLPCPFDLAKLKRVKNFWDFDNLVTAPLHNFANANEYYELSSCRQYLPNITKTTLIIHAEDDPFMPTHVIPTTNEISSTTTLELLKNGGHVGFVTGTVPGKAEYWLEKRIPEFLNSLIK